MVAVTAYPPAAETGTAAAGEINRDPPYPRSQTRFQSPILADIHDQAKPGRQGR
jgi:hypothetical protein